MIARFITDNYFFIKEFRESFRHPKKVQERVLMRILNKNKNTQYGKKYNFKSIKSIEDYQKKVPVISYEDIIPYIEKIKNKEQNILTKNRVIYFATTSGTTKSVKLIPVTAERTKIFKRELAVWCFFMMKKFNKFLKGKTLYFAGPYFEFKTENIPCGSISGYLAHKTPWFLKSKLVVKPEIYNILDFDEKIRKIAISALLSKITQIGFASPIEAILFFDYIAENRDTLINELRNLGKIKSAARLAKIKVFNPANIWPELFLINCIKSKTNQIYLQALRKKIGKKDIIIRDPGIYSSEGRLSLCLDDKSISGIITANENLFEFLEQKDGKSIGDPLPVDKVEKGKEYLVIVTTPEGLYRYDMGDVVKITGYKGKLPLIEFVNRNNFLNIAGELAHENVLIESMQIAMKTAGVNLRSFTFLPLLSPTRKPRYEVFVETLGDLSNGEARKFLKIIDDSLQKNISDYRQMRNEFGRMDFPRLSLLKKGSYDAFDKKRITASGQPKPIYVSRNPEFKKNFEIMDMVEYEPANI